MTSQIHCMTCKKYTDYYVIEQHWIACVQCDRRYFVNYASEVIGFRTAEEVEELRQEQKYRRELEQYQLQAYKESYG